MGSLLAVLQMSEAEWREVTAALLQSNANLRNDGYQGHGHFFQCPSGHAYFIDDCGGAVQSRACPHCGAQIGGSQHRLTSDNKQHEVMTRMAREIQAAHTY